MIALEVAAPSVRSVPEYVSSRGSEAIEVAETVGLVLDEAQRGVLIDACGCREDDRWAAFEVAVDEPRQNGKGAIIEARELAGIFAWGERLILHSAHEFQTATEAMLRMEDLLAADPSISAQVKSVSRSHGSEGFIFKTGQRLRYRTRTKGGGRGFTGDTLILDEAMILADQFIAALLPTLSGRSVEGRPQVWYTGSAVDQYVHEHGLVFARLRARALRGNDPSLAFFEWSAAPPFDEEGRHVTPDHPMVADLLADVRAWARANPAFGSRISEEHIANELRSMDDRIFAVERLGIGDWPDFEAASESPISVDDWETLIDAKSQMLDPVALAFDVSPDRRTASITAAGLRPDGHSHVELVDRRAGTSWIVDRLESLSASHKPIGLLCDSVSPAASLVPELVQRGLAVTKLTANEHAQACGLIFDMVEQRRLRHLGQREFEVALKGAAKRPLGDAWAWSRSRSSIDITPLVSATLALWGARTIARPATSGRWKGV